MKASSMSRSSNTPQSLQVYSAFLEEAKKSILPFDALYRGRTIFPTRDDGSIFLSLAAFREHLLAFTLKEAYSKVSQPPVVYRRAPMKGGEGSHAPAYSEHH